MTEINSNDRASLD